MAISGAALIPVTYFNKETGKMEVLNLEPKDAIVIQELRSIALLMRRYRNK